MMKMSKCGVAEPPSLDAPSVDALVEGMEVVVGPMVFGKTFGKEVEGGVCRASVTKGDVDVDVKVDIEDNDVCPNLVLTLEDVEVGLVVKLVLVVDIV
eukprot:5544681-Amphidinium_carterae.1